MTIANQDQADTSTATSNPSPAASSAEKESSNGVKVKVFYTFQGADTTCLCNFTSNLELPGDDAQYVRVPLKECLVALCASCPDMLLYPDADCAVYSANFQETSSSSAGTEQQQLVWEGHGLLSWNLDADHQKSVHINGKVNRAENNVQVELQLHPTHRISKADYYHTLVRRRGPQMSRTTPSPPLAQPGSADDGSTPVRRMISLPSMQTIPPATGAPPPPGEPASEYGRYPPTSSPGAAGHRQSVYTSYSAEDDSQPRMLPPISRISPKESLTFFPPLSDISRGSPEDAAVAAEQSFKKRRLTPPMGSNIQHQHQQQQRGDISRSRTSPTVSLPPPSALLDLRKDDRYYGGGHHYPPLPPTTGARAYDERSMVIATTTQHPLPHHAAAATPLPAPPQVPRPQPPITTSTTTTFVGPTRVQTQHTAIGRRKKRDTKPPNVNDVRTFVQVEKDENGNYRLPVEIDSWTVLNLGTVVYDRPAFHNQRYIYPVGYKVKKWYRSMVDPRSDTQYTCEILDGGQEPIFRLEADDNPGEVYMGPTPTTVWTIAVRRAFAIRNMDYGHNPVGPDFFGLRKNTIAKMIQDLPDADKCKNYIWQTFKIGTTGRTARGKIFRSEDVSDVGSSASNPSKS